MTTGSLGNDRNSIICTACGAANPPDSRFCERCGTRLPQQLRDNQPTRILPIPTPPIPAAEVPGSRPAPPAAPDVLDTPLARMETAQESPIRDEAPDPSDPADSPTVTIDLAPTRETTRNAPTETSDLPQLSHPASDAPAATPTPLPSPLPTGDQPTQIASGWNYRSWTPPPGGATSGPGQHTEPSSTAPSREFAPVPILSPTEATQIIRPAAGTGAAQERVSTPEEPPFVTSTTAPLTYPSAGTTSGGAVTRAGQPYGGDVVGGGASGGTPGIGQAPAAPGGSAPPPTGYIANAGQYPAPATGSNNRTLWIILGVLGGLALLCIVICLLIVIVAAVGASNTAGVATSVATATRR